MTPAQQLGPYRLIERIGRGGMGEVWKARDTRLDREVAVKISAEQFSDRFEREARAIAALNHPNICTLFDVGPNYLVMELIDGPTLADRIAEGPIPLEEALAIARQIADALEAAHEKNIVHRDLKPGNIKVRSDGSVKVLDFGLAKAGLPGAEVSHDSPTLVHSPTLVGVILGTAAYMAPEQARGKTVDKRADIWSFGVVLHEMLTGKRTFEGEDLTETLASVVMKEPDLDPVPRKVRRLLAKCLQKDPKKRLRDIGDVWELLDFVTAPSQSRLGMGWRVGVAWIAAGVLGVAAIVFAFLYFRKVPPAPVHARFTIATSADKIPVFAQIAPDGKRVVLTLNGSGKPALYLRSIDSEDLKPIPGTENARAPAWSPDGRFIAFLASGKLKVVPTGGGPVQSLCDAGTSGIITWSRDGTILYNGPNAAAHAQLWRTTAAGGSCTAVSKSDFDAGTATFLPDGRHFLFIHRDTNGSDGVYLADLGAVHDGDLHGRKILPDISSVSYAPAASASSTAHLLFLRDHSLMAQPFDEKALQTVGDAHLVSDHASFSYNANLTGASASSDGTIVYLSGLDLESELTWFDRTGKETGILGGIHEQRGVSLSPDGRYALVRKTFQDGGETWVYDLTRNSERRLTPRGNGGSYAWSPDSASIWAGQAGANGAGVYRIQIATGEQAIIEKDLQRTVADLSRDGRFFVFTHADPKTQTDIWFEPVEAGKPGAAKRLVAGPEVESQGQISPDGKWLAYYSDETGTGQIYVRPFPAGGEGWRVSTAGTHREPRWRADGKELFFLSRASAESENLMSVAVESDGHGGLRPGTPQKLFEFRTVTINPQSNEWSYSPTADGKRFLMNALTNSDSASAKVILNWQAGLKE